jgi:hypothetical protein
MNGKIVIVLALAALPANAAAAISKQPGSTLTSERMPLAPGGTVRLEHSTGYLTVEGWDHPEVEIITSKTTDRYYSPEKEGQATARLERMHIAAGRRSETEVVITTKTGGHFLAHLPPKTRGGVSVEYQLHVPRDARMVVHQRGGYVLLSGLTGDIDASNTSGDIMVMLPEGERCSIDARSKFGSIASDLGDAGHRWYLMGESFVRPDTAMGAHIRLRVRWGNITIKELPVEREAAAAGAAK